MPKTQPVQLKRFIHKRLKIVAAKNDEQIANYANVLLARALGIVPDDADMPVADMVKALDAMEEIEEQPKPALETSEAKKRERWWY